MYATSSRLLTSVLTSFLSLQMTPSHVTVTRCRGSCLSNPAYSCRASSSRRRAVEVMMVRGGFRTGLLETVCSSVEVVEETECECGCEVRREDCDPLLHLYSDQSCSCSCRQQAGCGPRQRWDWRGCRCVCREDSWTLCSTGYLFDSQDSCQCVPGHYTADPPIITTTVLLFLLALSAITSLLLYSRRSRDRRRRRESLARVLDEEEEEEEEVR